MLTIGLTGGMGSGKSTVADLFLRLKVTVIDADSIAKTLVSHDHTVIKKITEHFGQGVVDSHQAIKRKALQEIIFNDANERRWLEQLLHPLIVQEIQQQISQTNASYCIVMVPLLLETETKLPIDRILVVDCSEALQLDRIMKRDHLTATLIKKIIAAQLPRQERLAHADDVITNDEDMKALEDQVKKLHEHYLALSQSLN